MTVEKEEKPQKLYEIKAAIYDDGVIDVDMVEIVRQERGAPKKWMLERADFQTSLKSQLSTTPSLLGDELLGLLGFKPKKALPAPVGDGDVEDDEFNDDFDVE